MKTSNTKRSEVFVWIWLPGTTVPVVAGVLTQEQDKTVFNYGQSYLSRSNAISIYDVELPLRSGALPLLSGLNIPGCIRDASPDAWGRRVIHNRIAGMEKRDQNSRQLNELTYLLESGSDRMGALDFQSSPSEYVARFSENAKLSELIQSAERVENGIPLTPDLDQALFHGSSIGGARPKALIEEGRKKYIAKFSSSSDLFSVVKAEFIAMKLAKIAGLNVSEVALKKSANKDVLLVERFDRVSDRGDWQRRSVVSALTLLGLDEMMARYASYQDLAEIIRQKFSGASQTLHELFARISFNILVGNTDDHARNHAAFWDGKMFDLTPAYDICPQGRAGGEASQAMLISGENRRSQISVGLEAAHLFLLSREEAIEIVGHQLEIIHKHWDDVCAAAKLNRADQMLLWGRQFLNPFAFEELTGKGAGLRKLAAKIRG